MWGELLTEYSEADFSCYWRAHSIVGSALINLQHIIVMIIIIIIMIIIIIYDQHYNHDTLDHEYYHSIVRSALKSCHTYYTMIIVMIIIIEHDHCHKDGDEDNSPRRLGAAQPQWSAQVNFPATLTFKQRTMMRMMMTMIMIMMMI